MHDLDLSPDTYFSCDISKTEEQPDGSVMVYGTPANPETLDSDDQIADLGWLKRELPEWFHSYGNVREMHQASAVGTAKALEWQGDKPQVAAKVVDPVAAQKVREGVYKAFSVGVKNPELQYDPSASNGRIVGGKIIELSLVDRPAIPGSDIDSFKAADSFVLCKAVGMNEWLDTQHGVVIADDEAARLDKSASVDDGEAVEAPIDTAKEATSEMDTEKTVGGDAEKSADALAKAEAYCPQCGSLQKIAGGTLEKVGGIELVAGRCPEGHELRKVVSVPELGKAADTDKTDDADAEKADSADKSDTAEKAGDADDSATMDAAEKGVEAPIEKADDTDKADSADVAKGDDSDDEDPDAADDQDDQEDEDGSDKAALVHAVEKVDNETLKAALVDVLKEAGIDLGKVGQRTAQVRVDRLKAATDELVELAKGSVGGPTQTTESVALNQTRFVDAIRIVNQLAALIAGGNGTFDVDAEGHEGADLGVAEPIKIRDRINTNDGSAPKAAVPDLTKAEIIHETTKLVGPELAKSVAAHMERAFAPLVQRLEKVEHSVKPASPPILVAADRGHALDADLQKQASEEKLQADLQKQLAGLPDQDREKLLATLIATNRGW